MSESKKPTMVGTSTYMFDAESEQELSRLLLQSRLLAEEMGGVWAEQPDVSKVQHVLDLACGSGGWVLDVAMAYPDKKVMGVDISQKLILYAKAQAQTLRLENVEFAVMDINQPLPFPDASFDLINARYLVTALLRERWSVLLKECWRLLRPGGIARLTEPELPLTNSTACDRLNGDIALAMHRKGYGFSPRGRQFGQQMELEPLLREAGFEQTSVRVNATNASRGTRYHEVNATNHASIYVQVQPLLLAMGCADSPAELTTLYEQACNEMWGENFHSIQIFLTAWGRKPLTNSEDVNVSA